VNRPRAPFRTPRAAALALGLVIAAGFALPLLFCVLAATAGPEAVAGPSVAEESSAALGGVQRLLHGDGSVRVEPLAMAPEVSVAPKAASLETVLAREADADPAPSFPVPASGSRRL